MFDWQDLLTAFALCMVIEGALPFLNPPAFRRFAQALSELKDFTLRFFALLSMTAGAALLYLAR